MPTDDRIRDGLGMFGQHIPQQIEVSHSPTGLESGVSSAAYPIIKFMEGFSKAKQEEAESRMAERQNILSMIGSTIRVVEGSDLTDDAKRQLIGEGMSLMAKVVSEAAAKDLQRAKHPVARAFLNILTEATGGALPKKVDSGEILSWMGRANRAIGGMGPAVSPDAAPPATGALTETRQPPPGVTPPVTPSPRAALEDPSAASRGYVTSQPVAPTPQEEPPAKTQAPFETSKRSEISPISRQDIDQALREIGGRAEIRPHLSRAIISAIGKKVEGADRSGIWREDLVSMLGVPQYLGHITEEDRQSLNLMLASFPSRADWQSRADSHGIDITGLPPKEAIKQYQLSIAPITPVMVVGKGVEYAKAVGQKWFDLTGNELAGVVGPVSQNVEPTLLWDSSDRKVASGYWDKSTGKLYSSDGYPLDRQRYMRAEAQLVQGRHGIVSTFMLDETGQVRDVKSVTVDPEALRLAQDEVRARMIQAQAAIETAKYHNAVTQTRVGTAIHKDLQPVLNKIISEYSNMVLPQQASEYLTKVVPGLLEVSIRLAASKEMESLVAAGRSRDEAKRIVEGQLMAMVDEYSSVKRGDPIIMAFEEAVRRYLQMSRPEIGGGEAGGDAVGFTERLLERQRGQRHTAPPSVPQGAPQVHRPSAEPLRESPTGGEGEAVRFTDELLRKHSQRGKQPTVRSVLPPDLQELLNRSE